VTEQDGALRLDAMTQTEFERYLAAAIGGYAEEKVESGEWAAEEALDRSLAAHAELLPQGLATPDSYLFIARKVGSGEPVAHLWIALRARAGRTEAYIYDIEVREELRGRGYGRTTMRAALTKARELGAASVGLHVFGHNMRARALYESLGFAAKNINMSLEL
jgi:ribosomal protein S18 acetylase RimI-like enzyme